MDLYQQSQVWMAAKHRRWYREESQARATTSTPFSPPDVENRGRRGHYRPIRPVRDFAGSGEAAGAQHPGRL
jgi:hypothetical protein